MAIGKHVSRYKSFESLEESRKEKARRRAEYEKDDEKVNVNNGDIDSEKYDDEYDEDDDEELLNYKKVIIAIVTIIVVFLLAFGIYKLVSDNDKEVMPAENVKTIQSQEEKLPLAVGGYKVLGQVLIEDLEIEQYILDSKEDKALESGVTKLYGPSLNDDGNFCIAGHNYEGIFKDLEKLNVDDEIIIKDANGDEYEYKVTSVKNVDPDNLEILMQNKEKVEITLITCTADSTSRVIVKAEKVSKDNR